MASHTVQTRFDLIGAFATEMMRSAARHGVSCENLTITSMQEMIGIYAFHADRLETIIEGRNRESIKALLKEADVEVTSENFESRKKLFKKAGIAIVDELTKAQMKMIAEIRAQEDLDSLVAQMRRDLNEGRRSSARLAKRPRT